MTDTNTMRDKIVYAVLCAPLPEAGGVHMGATQSGLIADAILSALPSTVPPLVWECEAGWRWCGKSSLGYKSVCAWVWIKPDGSGYAFASDKSIHPTLEDAKAAADAHHAAQIMRGLGL